MRRAALLLSVICLTAAYSCVPAAGPDQRTRRILASLDGYVKAAPVYEARKKDHLETLRKMSGTASDPVRAFEIEMEIASEYFSYSFDSTQSHLKRCRAIASDILKDKARCNEASIMLGKLYTKSGNFMESYDVLYKQIDHADLAPGQKADYYMAVYDLTRDLSGNSGVVEYPPIMDIGACREQLYGVLEPDSERWRSVRMNQLTDERKLESADSLCRILLAGTSPESHQYAIYAYEMSDIAYFQGRNTDRLEWLVKSAQCDIINAVKDYASLTMVAQIILPQDADRSFEYLLTALNDAILYNAKLRPWQISRFFLQVEEAYQQRQDKMVRAVWIGLVTAALLAVILFALTVALISRSRKLSKVSKTLENRNLELASANASLGELNSQIYEADKIKENYIIGFLESLAEQITTVRGEDNRFRNYLKQGKSEQLLKELSVSGRSEKAKEHFYKAFDSTFLGIYPKFVEQFNALLEPSARIIPPKGRLSTELRIFALIRLGVDDSKRIAAMLDYSLSTIYNYKVSIKNAAICDRDGFEEQVKRIGK